MPSKIRILYWKEIPVQVEAEDASTKISMPLDPRFQEAADAIAMFDGSYGSDEYLDAWQWGDHIDSQLDAKEAAETTSKRYNEKMPDDFVARIRDMHNSQSRNPSATAIDHWLE